MLFINFLLTLHKKGNTSNFLYRADGTKLKKTYTITNYLGIKVINTEYLDGFQYSTPNIEPIRRALEEQDNTTLSAVTAGNEEAFSFVEDRKIAVPQPPQADNLVLSFFPTAEGFYDYENLRYIYQYKDHLGNVRVSFDKDGSSLKIMDSNDYYPFGMSFIKNDTNSVYDPMAIPYNYKYNGKELQETGMYDYGARMYMPDIGRWGVVDPLAETSRRWSPYTYAYNNPIRFIDPDGRKATDDYKLKKNGHLELTKKTNDNFDRIYNSDKSSSINVAKGILDKKMGTSSNTILVNNNTKDLSKAYKFFAKNSNVEWSYNVFKGDRTVGTLATSHTEGAVEDRAAMAYRVLGADPKIKLIYSSHSHPGKYDNSTGWPAYPSGFDSNLNSTNESGDRQNYGWYKDNYSGRIPSTFNIFVPDNPDATVNYDNNAVQRTLPRKTQEIQEVIITIKKIKPSEL